MAGSSKSQARSFLHTLSPHSLGLIIEHLISVSFRSGFDWDRTLDPRTMHTLLKLIPEAIKTALTSFWDHNRELNFEHFIDLIDTLVEVETGWSENALHIGNNEKSLERLKIYLRSPYCNITHVETVLERILIPRGKQLIELHTTIPLLVQPKSYRRLVNILNSYKMDRTPVGYAIICFARRISDGQDAVPVGRLADSLSSFTLREFWFRSALPFASAHTFQSACTAAQ